MYLIPFINNADNKLGVLHYSRQPQAVDPFALRLGSILVTHHAADLQARTGRGTLRFAGTVEPDNAGRAA